MIDLSFMLRRIKTTTPSTPLFPANSLVLSHYTYLHNTCIPTLLSPKVGLVWSGLVWSVCLH
jgi:hypothetical protein